MSDIRTSSAEDFVETGEIRDPEAGEFFLSDGSARVVFSVVQEPTIQVAFSGKPLLELTPTEATQLLRQLDAVLL